MRRKRRRGGRSVGHHAYHGGAGGCDDNDGAREPRSHGVVVSTQDFESCDPSSNLGGTLRGGGALRRPPSSLASRRAPITAPFARVSTGDVLESGTHARMHTRMMQVNSATPSTSLLSRLHQHYSTWSNGRMKEAHVTQRKGRAQCKQANDGMGGGGVKVGRMQARGAVTRIRTWVLAATTRCPNH